MLGDFSGTPVSSTSIESVVIPLLHLSHIDPNYIVHECFLYIEIFSLYLQVLEIICVGKNRENHNKKQRYVNLKEN